ncbi:MAG: cobalt ECF transporter T component CbiQ [Chloroflexota bacterium]
MKLELDEYAYLESPIHRWDPRTKLIGLVVLIFAFSAVQDLRLVPAMLAITVVVFAISHLPISYLVDRLKLPGIFLLALAAILPFTAGSTILFSLGPVDIRQEGILSILLIASRFVCIITVTLVLFGTAPFLTSIKAMRSLGLSEILTDMILLTYRYLFEIGDQLATMRKAIRLRGFDGHQLSRRNLNTVAALIGSMLIRSYEQAEQVYKAMVLRGYGYAQAAPDEFETRAWDYVLCGVVVVVAVGLAGTQFWLNWV